MLSRTMSATSSQGLRDGRWKTELGEDFLIRTEVRQAKSGRRQAERCSLPIFCGRSRRAFRISNPRYEGPAANPALPLPAGVGRAGSLTPLWRPSAVTPKEVLALIREKEVRAVDL